VFFSCAVGSRQWNTKYYEEWLFDSAQGNRPDDRQDARPLAGERERK
jgi:hypothetical protein